MGSDRARGWLLVAGQLALLAVLIFAPREPSWEATGILRFAGALLRVLGLVAIVGSIVNLGLTVSAHPEPPASAALKTDGLFRYVRHPIYSGLLALGAGIAISKGSAAVVVAELLLIGLLWVKSGFEERLLRLRFPEYEEYAGRTPRFIPRPRAMFL